MPKMMWGHVGKMVGILEMCELENMLALSWVGAGSGVVKERPGPLIEQCGKWTYFVRV